MINRCKLCDAVAPDFSEVCDACNEMLLDEEYFARCEIIDEFAGDHDEEF